MPLALRDYPEGRVAAATARDRWHAPPALACPRAGMPSRQPVFRPRPDNSLHQHEADTAFTPDRAAHSEVYCCQ